MKHQISKICKELNFVGKIDKILDISHSVSVKHLKGSLAAFAVAGIWTRRARNIMLFAENKKEAEDLYQDISVIIGSENTAILTEAQKHVKYHADMEDQGPAFYLEGLNRISSSDNIVAITTPEIFDIELPPPGLIQSFKRIINKSQVLDFDIFYKSLLLNGYERKDYVENPGDLAVRGGIVDLYPPGWDNPLRIEFWGNEIESLREFEPISQRSICEHESIEFLGSMIYQEEGENKGELWDYISDDSLLVLKDPDSFNPDLFPHDKVKQYKRLYINKLGDSDIQVESQPQPEFKGAVKNLVISLTDLHAYKTRSIISAEGNIHLDRLKGLVENSLNIEENLKLLSEEYQLSPAEIYQGIYWNDRTFSGGFLLKNEALALFTEHQVFGRKRMRRERKEKSRGKGITLKELKKLNIGDYVVHEDKGIGVFDGFERVRLGGSAQDCARIIYDGGDLLYVHLNYIHKIQQYSASEGAVPKVNKLGSAEWARKKARTKKKLKDIARDLIKLYAERKMEPGFAFPTDTVWQKEFEASFIYEDTPDQATTTDELKHDMESEHPMDRLVCGDVGFGKTEIAIRAAFKAVQAGKQVGVLVPTTILAQQHHMTFRDRLINYPVITKAISRFRSKAKQKEILDRLHLGGVDILIGTHRILSKDVKFKNLGLLIIDEEHRFGVAAKEKLRQMRVSVDTLTLTATPIPRTLNFSLMGARDLSIINTPPRNRIPVYTEISEWNDDLIKKSITRELDRGGQVFFVSDRVEGLDKLAMDLQMLMPEIRICTAHGQMKPSELEKVMEKFVQGKYDLLLTTKIIESGLDIPNANTIIINRSDNFGLAELYQLRGRVGRTNIQAYCYLLIPPVKKLSRKALQRLQAIEEFTDLGSGFQLAMRDLEIRGAGNLLGPEQSGFINEIGIEMYQKVLDEAVAELRVEEFSEIFTQEEKISTSLFENEDIAIELDKDALLPETYIKSETDRFNYYKKLYKVRTQKELNEIVDELRDRFGHLPDEAVELTFAVKVRMAAVITGFTRIIVRKKQLLAEFPDTDNEEYYRLFFPLISEFIQELPEAGLREKGKKLFLQVNIPTRDNAVEILYRLRKNLEEAEI